MKAPQTYEGKELVYDEEYKSNTIYSNALSAQCDLEIHRQSHIPAKGWVEFEAGVEKANGGYIAYSHHALYL